MSMTPDELVTRNDIAKMQENILKAMEAMLHPADPYLSFEQAAVDPSEIAEYVVRIDEFSLFAVPNPKVSFNLFEHVITQLGRGEYVKLFTERCPYTEEDKNAIVRNFRGE